MKKFLTVLIVVVLVVVVMTVTRALTRKLMLSPVIRTTKTGVERKEVVAPKDTGSVDTRQITEKKVVVKRENQEQPLYYSETTLEPEDTNGIVIERPPEPIIRRKESAIPPEDTNGIVIRRSPEPIVRRNEPTIPPDDPG